MGLQDCCPRWKGFPAKNIKKALGLVAMDFPGVDPADLQAFLIDAGEHFLLDRTMDSLYLGAEATRKELNTLKGLYEALDRALFELSPGCEVLIKNLETTARAHRRVIEAIGEALGEDPSTDDPYNEAWLDGLYERCGDISLAIDKLNAMTSSRGRKSMAARLGKSSDEKLAERCAEFARAHSRSSEAVIARLIQSIKTLNDSESCLNLEGKSRKAIGRSAAKKML